MATVRSGTSKPAMCGLPPSNVFWTASSVLLLSPKPSKIAVATAPLMLAATMPGSCERGVERHRNDRAGIRGARSGDDEHRARPALARGHRLVAQVRVAREDPFRLRIRVLGEVAEHEDDLVLHVERRVAVVREILAVGHHDAVAGKDHGAGHIAVVGERERLDVHPCLKRAGGRGCLRSAGDRNRCPAVASARCELERQPIVGSARQRARADPFQLRNDVLAREAFSRRTGKPSPESLGGERLHVGPGLRRGHPRLTVNSDGRRRHHQRDQPSSWFHGSSTFGEVRSGGLRAPWHGSIRPGTTGRSTRPSGSMSTRVAARRAREPAGRRTRPSR